MNKLAIIGFLLCSFVLFNKNSAHTLNDSETYVNDAVLTEGLSAYKPIMKSERNENININGPSQAQASIDIPESVATEFKQDMTKAFSGMGISFGMGPTIKGTGKRGGGWCYVNCGPVCRQTGYRGGYCGRKSRCECY